MLEASENSRVPRTVPSGATSVAVARAPEGLKRPKTETSEERLPVKRTRVAPCPSESAAERAGIEKPKEEPSSSAREERTVAARSPAAPLVMLNRTGPKSATRSELAPFRASEINCVSPGATVKLVLAAKAAGEYRKRMSPEMGAPPRLKRVMSVLIRGPRIPRSTATGVVRSEAFPIV